jgi:hypothetical protein
LVVIFDLCPAPFISSEPEQYPLVPLSDDRGICLGMNEAAWQQFGCATLLECRRKKKVLNDLTDMGAASAWEIVCRRLFGDVSVVRSLDQFHDDVTEAIVATDKSLPDNSLLARFSAPTTKSDSQEVKAPEATSQKSVECTTTNSLSESQTIHILMENIDSQFV